MIGTAHFSPESRWSKAEVTGRAFGTARRGYDQAEVRAFLEQLAAELDAATRREQELAEKLAAVEEQARHPVLDEGALSAALGQRSAAVLRNAHEEAARIAQKAEESAAVGLREAQAHATDVQVGAESQAAERIAEAELEATALRNQAREDATAVIEAARAEGESIVERAREHGRAMLDQAQEARRRVLADMAHRRRAMTEQIEQFRAARDEIAGSVVGVRRSLDRIVEDLGSAEDAARSAAADVAHARTAPATEQELVAEAESAAGELGLPTGALEEHATAAPVTAPDPAPTATAAPVPAPTVAAAQVPAQAPPEAPVAAPTPAPAPAPAPLYVEEIATVVAKPPADPEDEVSEAASEVEELFARLRAQRPAADVGDGGGAGEIAVTAPVPGGDEELDPGAAFGEPDTGQAAGTDTGAGSPEPADAEPLAATGPDAAMLAARDEALEPVVTSMARRLKRALQDDQNRLLDRLRQGTGEWSDELLADEGAQRAMYAKAASPGVRDSVAAGTQFARSVVGGRRSKAATQDERTVDAIAEDLSVTIVALLRRRLEGVEIPDAAERIGAAYREWRGERIERLTEDRAIEAFDAGVLAGATHGEALRWVRSESVPGCADCEDNALAGELPPGEEFPTGHRYPPAHPGCRCMVVPTAS